MPTPGYRTTLGIMRSRSRWSLRSLRDRGLTGAKIWRMTVTLILAWLTMAGTILLVPGVSASLAVDVLVATVLLGLLSAVLRPLLTSLALLLGWTGVLLAGFGGQALLF